MCSRVVALSLISVLQVAACSDDSAPARDAAVDSHPVRDIGADGPQIADARADQTQDINAVSDQRPDNSLADQRTPDGAPGQSMKLYFKKPASWQTAYIHYWGTSPGAKSTTWPGLAMTDAQNGWTMVEISGEQRAGIVFHDNDGQQTVDLYRVGSGYFVIAGQTSGKDSRGQAVQVKSIGRWSDDNPDTTPVVTAYPEGGNFYGSKVQVELGTEGSGITSRRFTLDGSDPAVGGQTFTDGQLIDVGAASAEGDSITLRIYAATSQGAAERRLTFKKNAETTVEPWTPTNKPDSETTSGRWVYLKQFNNDQGLEARDVTIYLPADYATKAHRRYRVVYFHDGQNLFSPSTATFGQEWMVDEHYDELRTEALIHPVIFVGIWSAKDGDTRTKEYVGGCNHGDAKAEYAAWVIHSLKPYIDHHYRTRAEAEFTYTMGSSFGGIISWYVSWNHPEVFGNAACVSTAFHCAGAQLLADIVAYAGAKKQVRYWMDGGFKEGDDLPTGRTSYVENNRLFAEKLASLGWRDGDDLGFLEVVGEGHNETAWSHRIKQILYFMLRREAPRPVHIVARTALDAMGVGGETYAAIDVRYENGPLLTKVFGDTTKPATLTATPPTAVTVDGAGKVRGVAAGTVTIDASYEGFSASTTLIVQ